MNSENVTVESYFKVGDELLDAYQYSGPFFDEDVYIEGAIILKIGTKEVLGPKHWDDVVMFWELFVTALEESSLTKETIIYFPDQPSKIRIIPSGNDSVIIYLDDERKGSVKRLNLLNALVEEAMRFFTRMSILLPSQAGYYKSILDALNNLKLH
jgi:hypothetical protein